MARINTIIKGRNDVGLITSKGFVVTKHVPGIRIELNDPNTGNCFVARTGIDSVELIDWYGKLINGRLHDPDTEEIQQKKEFVKKHGMIIVPQYCLSYKNCELKSIAGEKPFVNMNWQDSYDLFSMMKLPKGVSISMIAGFEVDQCLQHIIDTEENITRDDIIMESKVFGGHVADEVYETGREGTPCIDGVYDQIGLVRYWTQQMSGGDGNRVVWGACCKPNSGDSEAANKYEMDPKYKTSFWSSTGTLYWKN